MIIYKITNKVNNKIYIGQTKTTLQKRWRRHTWDCTTSNIRMAISHAIKKHGKENFTIVEIDNASNLEELNEKEEYYIKLYNSMSPNGYNLTSGGKVKLVSEETKIKISLSNKGKKASPETLKKLSESHKGFKVTEETKKKLSLINKGKTPHINTINASREKNSKTYNIISPNGDLVKIKNLREFCRCNNLPYNRFNELVNNKRYQYKGWKLH